MFLFNLIFEKHFISSPKYTFVTIPSAFKSKRNIRIRKKNISMLLVVDTRKTHNYAPNQINKNFYHRELSLPNKIQSFLNTYCQRVIFFYPSNIHSEKYAKILRLLQNIYNNRQFEQLFFSELNKDLMSGKINSRLKDRLDFAVQNQTSSVFDIKYVWRKNFFLRILNKLSNTLFNKQQLISQNQVNKHTLSALKESKFPVFTLTNKFNQIIVSEPAEEILIGKGAFTTLYNWFLDIFALNSNIRIKYKSWFFVNPKDAIEFRHYIKNKYPASSREHGLNIVAVNLGMYYKLSRANHSRVEFRLIPDLNEVAQLITKYKYQKNLYFHPNQQYGQDYFKGQPIYILQLIDKTNADKDILKHMNYCYHIPQSMQCKSVFTNYNLALKAKRRLNICGRNNSFNTVIKILVYNLEDVLNDINVSMTLEKQPFLFVPSKDSYDFIKYNGQEAFYVLKNISPYLFNIQLWIKRIVYSLTTKRPTNV